eukprot:1425872-Rhodomonas_salina.1
MYRNGTRSTPGTRGYPGINTVTTGRAWEFLRSGRQFVKPQIWKQLCFASQTFPEPSVCEPKL